MIQNSKRLAGLSCCALIAAVTVVRLHAEPMPADETTVTKTNFARLERLISGSEFVGVNVDLEGEVLWVDSPRDQFVLQTDAGALRVKNVSAQPVPVLGQHVRLAGHGTAGQGFLDNVEPALVDNDGIHSAMEKSGTVHLTAGRHPIRAEWFNGPQDYYLSIEYAGPNLERQQIPDKVLFRLETNGAGSDQRWMPGLNYHCYEGNWVRLTPWPNLEPVKAGNATNFDLSLRTRDQEVALLFTGYLQIDREGVYTFWTTSDDGSRLYIDADALQFGTAPLHVEALGSQPLPEPRAITPGQELNSPEDYFWAVAEGVVTGIHVDPDGASVLELCAGTNRMELVSSAAAFHPPGLFSRIRATGLCCPTPLAGGGRVAGQLLVASVGQVEELAPAPACPGSSVATLAELRRLAADAPRISTSFCLTGTVITAVSPQGSFAFQDKTGGVIIQLKQYDDRIRPGQKIRLKGNGVWDENKLILDQEALVNDDGIHNTVEKSGAAYLTAGRHPIHVSWFNHLGAADLEIYYQGPDLPRTKIPDSALFHPQFDKAGGGVRWVAGMNYTCYNGDWESVPRISELKPVEMGTATNFVIQVANRAEKVGLEFSGYLEVPRDGLYHFSVLSDDGGLLFLDEQVPEIESISTQSLPEPFPIYSHQALGPDQDNRWSETAGTVNFVSERAGSLFLDLNSVYGPMRVEVVDGSGSSPLLMLGAQVKVQGFCQSALVADGQSLVASMVVPGMEQVQLTAADPMQWNRYPLEPIGNAAQNDFSSANEAIVHVQGQAQINQSSHKLMLTDASGTIPFETGRPGQTNLAGIVEVIGQLSRTGTNVVLRCGIYRKLADQPEGNSERLPLLTTVQQIKHLTREQAWRRYPVKVRGVVTLVRDYGSGLIIQDDTSAIDVWWPPYSTATEPKVGDCWEIEGETSVLFSPVIESRHAVRLGAGVMPEPLHPSWDQLLNGSLDTRYVEIQGIVTAAEDDAVILFTRAGIVRVLLSPVPSEPLSSYENAQVRIRGCVVPIRDEQSQQVLVGQFHLSNMSLNVDEPAPSDLFGVGLKHVSDLLLFDAQADALQRVKIAGQILHVHNGEIFMVDGTNAIRVMSREPVSLAVGDLAEAVGYPELKSGTSILREAVLRKTGSAPLPAPLRVQGASLFTNSYDGLLVSVQARLIGITSDMWERVLELQVGNRQFLARMENRNGLLMDPEPGSWLELTGIYSEQGIPGASGNNIKSFELLLNSPSDVKVLALPPWWTLPRALIIAGGMALVILATVFWIALLRRQVEKRSAQLEVEMRLRERLQRQNELEKERSRIARDMHDQLGANVTQIGLLAELSKKHIDNPDKIIANTDRISRTAFELGQSLDEIVWAVNPKNDSLNKFCDYMAVQAQELFQLTDILCRVDLPPEMPDHPLCAEVRHHLFHAVKEALNNVVRHANAREVWIRFELENSQFQISITDDGTGFVSDPKQLQRNGLQNMQKRLEEVGGSFAIAHQPDHGTKVTMAIGFDRMADKNGL